MIKLSNNNEARQLVNWIADTLVDEGDEVTLAWLNRQNGAEGFTTSKPGSMGSTVVTEGLHFDVATLDALYRAADGAIRRGLYGTPEFWAADINTLAAQA